MAVVANTLESYDLSGAGALREDLSDIIYDISPMETPVLTMIGRGTASSTTHEWQCDELEAVDADNKHIEGDDSPAFPAVTQTVRVTNFTQISRKLLVVSGSAEVGDKAGRKSSLAYQLAKRSKELKRDMEAILTAGNSGGAPQAKQVSSSGTARQLGPIETWITTGSNQPSNVAGDGVNTAQTDGFSPTNGAVRTDGTQRAFKEADLKDLIKQIWDEGGEGTTVVVGSFNKQAASAFSGNTTRYDRSEDMKLVTAIDVYVSDFGECRIVPDRFSRGRTAYCLTPRMWAVDYYRPFQQFALAKTGDAEKRQLLVEYTLRANNPHASGIVADLTTS